MQPKIFICYRRGDAGPYAELIYTYSSQIVGHAHVFLDVDSIPLGHDFRSYLRNYLDKVQILYVLIGPKWMEIGHSKFQDENDYVRYEIKYALEQGKIVVPVLLPGANLPSPKDLPEDIKDLIFRQGYPIDRNHVKRDSEYLTRRVVDAFLNNNPKPVSPDPAPKNKEFVILDDKNALFTDSRDGEQYKVVKLLDGHWWFAENLRFKIADS